MQITASVICLASAVFFEARSEPIDAQIAVAEVVINRVFDERYPATVCGVVAEPWAFSFTADSASDWMLDYNEPDAVRTALDVANLVLETGPSITSTHYHRFDVSPDWAEAFSLDGRLGVHLFYTNETPWR